MKKSSIIFTVIATLIANSLLGQSAGNVIYNNPNATIPQKININVSMPNDNNVYLQSEVMMNVKATSYTVIFSATQNGITAFETDSLMDIRLKVINETLKKLGINENEIHIDVISLVPTYALKLEEKKFSRTAQGKSIWRINRNFFNMCSEISESPNFSKL